MNIHLFVCFATEVSSTSLLRGQMDEEQARRFDTFSTVAINKNVIKRVCPAHYCGLPRLTLLS